MRRVDVRPPMPRRFRHGICCVVIAFSRVVESDPPTLRVNLQRSMPGDGGFDEVGFSTYLISDPIAPKPQQQNRHAQQQRQAGGEGEDAAAHTGILTDQSRPFLGPLLRLPHDSCRTIFGHAGHTFWPGTRRVLGTTAGHKLPAAGGTTKKPLKTQGFLCGHAVAPITFTV